MLKINILATLTAGFMVLGFIFLIAACTSSTDTEISQSPQGAKELRWLPEGAEIIKDIHAGDPGLRIRYIVFKLEGQCFIVSSQTHRGYLAPFNCPKGNT